MEDDEAAAVDWDVKSKRSANNAADVVRWIEAIVGSQKDEDVTVGEWLKSGVVLCNLVNAIRPGLIRTVNQQTVPFKQMENITKFLNAARELGLPESSMFDTPDLYEEKNLDSVITCIYALGGAVQTMCPDFGGPKLGIPLIAKGKDAAKPKSKTAPHLLHLDPEQVASMRAEFEILKEGHGRLEEENALLRKKCEVDIPHWASQVRQCGLDLEEAARPIVSVPLGQRLLDLVQVLQDTEEGLRGLRGAPLREELEELRRAFARHLEEGEQREAALQQELEMLRKMVPESPNSVL
ncbi:unnamed protein product [Effrenium voratum]|uniref:Calponin-homology (CH) domain-containing protein n=1 Tax=Effrenium voratum TaxID=2562239 RepID=A0AA36MXB4_9DINO|nr:unnamed protein product [Effrenium voratum]CAJ1424645.1 unnamed protein product [Effrenium voratum]